MEMADNLQFPAARVKSVFSIMMLTKRLKALPLTLDVGERGTTVARSEATAAVPVAVLAALDTLTICAEATETPARRTVAKDNILPERESQGGGLIALKV
jgi:hypothetical protein